MFDKEIHPIVFQWLGHFLWAGTRPAPAKRNQMRKIGEAEIFIIFQIRVRRKKKKITMNQLNEFFIHTDQKDLKDCYATSGKTKKTVADKKKAGKNLAGRQKMPNFAFAKQETGA